jgi:HD-like signal output (HDOD) protein
MWLSLALVLTMGLGWWAFWGRASARLTDEPTAETPKPLGKHPTKPTNKPTTKPTTQLAANPVAKPAARQPPSDRMAEPAVTVAGTLPAAEPQAPSPAAPERMPPELASLVWLRDADISPVQRSALIAAMGEITRPPGPLLQLLSAEFLANASTSQLSDLVMAEPLVAAKLLGQVNAPIYGLRRPVTDIAQAVALLGITTVRSICVQYMLAQAFEPASPARQRVLDTLWRSSAIASELSVRLGKLLNLPDQGSLPTRAVLGFVGPVATASMLPTEALRQWLTLAPAQRAASEQVQLGLTSCEIGGLLMASWSLPASLIDDVCDASRWLAQPAEALDAATAPRLALSYLCAHLGDRLASGHLDSLAGHDFMQEGAAATYHLRRYLSHPSLHLRSYLGQAPAQRLQAALQSPELLASVRRMQDAPAAA